VADTSAQRIIVSSILGVYPNLNIIGEEDESVEADVAFQRKLRDDLVDGYEWTAPLSSSGEDEVVPAELDMSQVVVYVDPLDGTREFVEGRLHNVQSLIGVCYKGKPIMGAIGLPFPTNEQSATEVVFGVVGKGIGKMMLTKKSGDDIVNCPFSELTQHHDGDPISISSGDSKLVVPIVNLAEKIFASRGVGISRQIAGATGNKLLLVTCGQTTLSLLHDKTNLWDTAAPTALLEAMGGRITDYFGEPLIYNSKEVRNALCVVASAPGAKREHEEIVKAMRGDGVALSILGRFGLKCEEGGDDDVDGNGSVVEQCVDITRDLDGYPLTNEYFAQKMGVADSATYTCPEKEAVRGLMSNGCRIHLQPSGDSAFYKRIVFEHLDHARAKMKTAPHKLVRDVKSYKVETSFLASKACTQVITKAGLKIPKCYDANLMPNDSNPIESKFSVLLEDFAPSDGWSQRWLLQSDAEAKATLTVLAKMHAFFWHGSSFWEDGDAAGELEEGVWESASYVQPKLQTLNQCKDVAKGWATSKLKCRKELESKDYWDNLGERLESVAEENGRLAHPFAVDAISKSYEKYRTFTHGDPKQANLFFRSSGPNNNLDVGLIDFQWAGFGLAATDVAHFLTAAVRSNLLENDGDQKLLGFYYNELEKYLIEYGVFSDVEEVHASFGFNTFVDQYETAFLDMCRLVIAYAWCRFEPVDKDDEIGCARTMNKNSYNKSMPNVIWMMSQCDDILKRRGV